MYRTGMPRPGTAAVEALFGPGRIEAANRSLRKFWHPYWTSGPALPAIRETDPFPPAPEKQDLGQLDSEYVPQGVIEDVCDS